MTESSTPPAPDEDVLAASQTGHGTSDPSEVTKPLSDEENDALIAELEDDTAKSGIGNIDVLKDGE